MSYCFLRHERWKIEGSWSLPCAMDSESSQGQVIKSSIVKLWVWNPGCSRDPRVVEIQNPGYPPRRAEDRVYKRVCVLLQAVDLEAATTQPLSSPANFITSPRCLTWSCGLWYLPCWTGFNLIIVCYSLISVGARMLMSCLKCLPP